MKILRYIKFVNELIHYIFYVSDGADDYIPIEIICRKLYKYRLLIKMKIIIYGWRSDFNE